MRALLMFAALAAGTAAAAQGNVSPQDKVLTSSMATTLTTVNVGKPLWALNAQCAGAFGASYQRTLALKGMQAAEADKQTGVAMLNTALARLQADRGIGRADATELVKVEIEAGRAKAREYMSDGTGAYTPWNFLRSTCLDMAALG
ncbi:MAG TPA: hypothetical protein VF559_08220 [Caulobacteraceae bacterium]